METEFAHDTLRLLKDIAESGPHGNRWFKVNLHVHAEGNDPDEVVRIARENEIDIIGITDHQTFAHFDGVAESAKSSGRPLTVLPGIEITSSEGVHILALFASQFPPTSREQLIGYLEVPGTGDTRVASKRPLNEILHKVENDLGGVVIIPHPLTENIGLLGRARKMSTKTGWLDSGHVHLIQINEDKVRHIGFDERGNWVNRYVLSSARPQDVDSSRYCLAPFNRSDSKSPEETSDGCSWFRMSQPTIDGLRQVACEPYSRISRVKPDDLSHDAVLMVRVTGGYCSDQVFRFNDALSCIVGENYAGKSALLDFVRFALMDEHRLASDSRARLLSRLSGILGADGEVEVYVRRKGALYLVRREFTPQYDELDLDVVELCTTKAAAYRYEPRSDELVPEADFEFPLEVYEQGRIGKIRDDLERQLAMLDEFAGTARLLTERAQVIVDLNTSAAALAPLYDERDNLIGELGTLPQLKEELARLLKQLPDENEERKWAGAGAFMEQAEKVVDDLAGIAPQLAEGSDALDFAEEDTVDTLFRQSLPDFDATSVVHTDKLSLVRKTIEDALGEIGTARQALLRAIRKLITESKPLRADWKNLRVDHDQRLGAQLRAAGFESPAEIVERVRRLRSQVQTMETKKQPRLAELKAVIGREETKRENHLGKLRKHDDKIAQMREEKALELTEALEGRIKVTVRRAGDRAEYLRILDELYNKIATREFSIKSRTTQFQNVASSISPIDLAEALKRKGAVRRDGEETTLAGLCGITEHTQDVLCHIAEDIQLLNRLQTTQVSDVPHILVQRRNESTFADLRSELSPGEQSAAILMLALQTRSNPLIVDQPEDELGFSYVVHLVVPKILEAKFSRQVIVVTHDANIPVLGDADYVTKMQNAPDPKTRRRCSVAAEGCFESPAVTGALLELEGGERAFQYRLHRYQLPSSSAAASVPREMIQPAPTDASPHIPFAAAEEPPGVEPVA